MQALIPDLQKRLSRRIKQTAFTEVGWLLLVAMTVFGLRISISFAVISFIMSVILAFVNRKYAKLEKISKQDFYETVGRVRENLLMIEMFEKLSYSNGEHNATLN